ncbi:MAG: pyrimidine reductase family protein [Nocardioides sp.]
MLMRRLLPAPIAQVDTLDAYAVAEPAGHQLRVNMVSGIDGGAAVGGRVGLLSGAADRRLLHELRSLCDVLLVGAGTIRAEGYGPLELSEEDQRRRVEAGQAPVPRLAVLTRSLGLDLNARVFTDATVRPLVVTTEAAPRERREEAARVAEVVVAGTADVDLGQALRELAGRDLPRVLSEGGPHVLASMFAADLVDELCLAVAPVVTGGTELRITAGPPLEPPRPMRLAHVLEADDFLFLRYTRGA